MSFREDQPKDFFDAIGEAQALGYTNDLEEFKKNYFQFGEYELKKYQEFVRAQIATGKVRYGTSGMNFSISFMPTGIGAEVWATCHDTDVSQSLLDLEGL
jgi:hypothetical protein